MKMDAGGHRCFAVAGVQARMGSSRLPGKSLATLAGVPMIQRICDRARAARHLSALVVLTSTEARDDALADYCVDHDIPVRRGSERDVLARYLDLIEEFDPRYVVRITGDCPFISPGHIDAQLETLQRFDADFAPAGTAEHIYLGQGAMSSRALREAGASDDPADREHVGSFWFARHASDYHSVPLEVRTYPGSEGLRLCVDEEPDLVVAREVYETLAPSYGSLIPLERVLEKMVGSERARQAAGAISHSEANRRVAVLRHQMNTELHEGWREGA